MAKTPSQKTRDMETRRRQRGLRELRLWVPNLTEVIQDMRDRAAMHRERAARLRDEANHANNEEETS